MLDSNSNVDDELELLGQIRTDVHAIVTRWLGEKPLTLEEVDSLLANLGQERAFLAPSMAHEDSPLSAAAQAPARPAPAQAAVASAPAAVESAPLASAPVAVATAPAALASAPVVIPTSLAESPLAASAAPLFDPDPSSDPPPAFESHSAAEPQSLLSNTSDEARDPEAQAQAIVAAFETTDVGSSTEALAAELESSLSELEASTRAAAAQNALQIDAARPARKRERSQGSRRPDLNELLDQPLDALDFERTEPVDEDAPAAEARHGELPTGAPPPAASGDDFEILVDDEILEIAEDDVEIVDDDDEST